MIFWLSGIRYHVRHPLQLFLAILGVALGVAVVIAIDLANSSAERAFLLSAEALSGRSSHTITAGSEGIPEQVYTQLRVEHQFRDIAPVIEGYARVPAIPGLLVRIVGIDPFAEQPFRSYSPQVGSGINLSQFLIEPGTALMSRETAQSLGLAPGDTLLINTTAGQKQIVLGGYLEAGTQVRSKALQNLLLFDLASAQEVLGQFGQLTRMDLIIPDGEKGDQTLNWLKSILPPNLEVISTNNRNQALVQMTRAFQLNLRALSLLALVVGGFLIYNTMTFSVLQRRPLLGSLRTMGVTRRELFTLTLTEALFIGLLGTFIGLVMGALLAQGLLNVVTRTINDLYFVLNIKEFSISTGSLAKGLFLGIGATLASAFVPSLEAAKTNPRTVLIRSEIEIRQHKLLPWALLVGLGIVGGGILGLMIPSKSIVGSFLMMFLLIIGYALMTPAAVVFLLNRCQPLIHRLFGVLGKMAVRNLTGSLSRTGVATAALVIAVAATIGVGLMINSFRSTVDQWLQSYLQADIYVTTANTNFAPGRSPLDPEFLEAVTKTPGVDRVTKARHLTLETTLGPAELFIAEIPQESFRGYWFKEGKNEEIFTEFQNQDVVIVSEPYAYHHNLKRGDPLTLPTDRGEKTFRISGIFTDYGSDRGRITMSRQLYAKYWDNPEFDALGVYVNPGVDAEEIASSLRTLIDQNQSLQVYSNQALREASLETFDRTFAVTSVLRMLAVLVAFVGILSALMAMQIERSRELAVLRASGLTPRQLWCLVIGETGLTGLVAGLLSIPLGFVQALVLILVINQRSFGWSMDVSIDPNVLIQAVILSFTASLLAGLYPAWRMSNTSPALAMRDDS